MPDRRGFLGAVAALVAAPWLPKPTFDWSRDPLQWTRRHGKSFIGYMRFHESILNQMPGVNAIITDLKDPYEEEDPDELDRS